MQHVEQGAQPVEARGSAREQDGVAAEPGAARLSALAHDPLWWKHTTVYQIYPRSFADSNGDGIGDLRGIIQRLPYLRELGVETLWLSPFYDSPQADFGYDIRDHFSVAKEYGSLEDTRELIDAVHRHGMKRSEEHTSELQSRRDLVCRLLLE